MHFETSRIFCRRCPVSVADRPDLGYSGPKLWIARYQLAGERSRSDCRNIARHSLPFAAIFGIHDCSGFPPSKTLRWLFCKDSRASRFIGQSKAWLSQAVGLRPTTLPAWPGPPEHLARLDKKRYVADSRSPARHSFRCGWSSRLPSGLRSLRLQNLHFCLTKCPLDIASKPKPKLERVCPGKFFKAETQCRWASSFRVEAGLGSWATGRDEGRCLRVVYPGVK